MLRSIRDEVTRHRQAGNPPIALAALSGRAAALVFEDGYHLDLTGKVGWGPDSSFEDRAALVKIAVFCGWVDGDGDGLKNAEQTVSLHPPDYVGVLWPFDLGPWPPAE